MEHFLNLSSGDTKKEEKQESDDTKGFGLELKPLPSRLKYIFLAGDSYSVIIQELIGVWGRGERRGIH